MEYTCKGYKIQTFDVYDYCCEYYPPFPCDECVFVVGNESNDMRRGKRPLAKKWQEAE